MLVIRQPGDRRDDRSPRDVLLAELDRLGGEGNRHAQVYASDIRREGQLALDRATGECAAEVVACKAFLTSTAVIAAFGAFDRSTSGRDWNAIPHELVRARTRPTYEQLLERAQRRQAEGFARARERINARVLATAVRQPRGA